MKTMSVLFSLLFSLMSFNAFAQAEANESNPIYKGAYALTHLELFKLKSYGEAWNSSNISGIIDHFSDTKFLYTDPLSQKGITDKDELRAYLERVFYKYPKQNWTQNVQIYKNPFIEHEWSIYYNFSLYTSKNSTKPAITGTGMERYRFDNNKKIILNEIHLIFDQIDLSKTLGIPDSL